MIGTKSIVLLSISAFMAWSVSSNRAERTDQFTRLSGSTPIHKIMKSCGAPMPLHYIEKTDSVLVRKGWEITHLGRTSDANGNRLERQSKHFVCVDCHNDRREDPDLLQSDPNARLNYAIQNNIPFLQGTTFHGIVNRRHFYNGDYAKKYGSLIHNAKDTLRNAIQVCATQCSQGRALNAYEMEAVLHYFNSLELKLSDLNFKAHELDTLNFFYNFQLAYDKSITVADENAIEMLQSKYNDASAATFLSTPDMRFRGNGATGNPETGKAIYRLSCMHCHAKGRVSQFELNDEKITFRFLKRHLNRPKFFNIYFHVREGTYAKPGHRPYMPNFTKERMSEQQLEDLIAYINQQAE